MGDSRVWATRRLLPSTTVLWSKSLPAKFKQNLFDYNIYVRETCSRLMSARVIAFARWTSINSS